MNTLLRRAAPGDERAFIEIKKQLPLRMSDCSSTTGGFLLGTDEETYREYISTSHCLVCESEGRVVGFGILFPDEVLRGSDIWVRRHTATWAVELAHYEPRRLCYFEQFAFLGGYKRSAVALAYNLVKGAFDRGAQTLFTTTVNKPILNLAAIPFINAVDGIKAGNIDETYPILGHINSDIYLVDGSTFYAKTKTHPLYDFCCANTIDF